MVGLLRQRAPAAVHVMAGRPRRRAQAAARQRRSSTAVSTTGREADRERRVANALAILRGADASPGRKFALAAELRRMNEMGLARRLLANVRAQGDFTGIPGGAVAAGQQHALATYKDPDLPSGDRFQSALEILDEVDRLDLDPVVPTDAAARARFGPQEWVTHYRQESLGLRGAVHKRRWQETGQRHELERSLACHLAGHALGVGTDDGYNGINASYVMDLLTREDLRAHGALDIPGAPERLAAADRIRRELLAALDRPASSGEDARRSWWYHATIAEARLGLGQCAQAVDALRAFGLAQQPPVTGLPVAIVDPWMLESTLTQLGSVLDLRAELAAARGGDGPAEVSEARRLLTEYLGAYAPALDRFIGGKIGLALSGGGFRASFFHIGVLAHLAERDLLRKLEVLSCVSGGSIVGAHLYLEIQQLLTATPDGEANADRYAEIIARLERDFLAGVESNIRTRLFANAWANLRAFLQPGYSPTRRLGALYESLLYSRVGDGKGARPRLLTDLIVEPCGEEAFKPKYDNWRRAARVPILVLNATTLNTGHVWQFTATWMGEPPSGLHEEIDGNYRLRRVYHRDAPAIARKWSHPALRWLAPIDNRRIRLGEAVAASSCVPGLFDPLVLPDLYEGKTVRLVDGGVYDNQGTASLLEQGCSTLIVSDASGQMGVEDDPSSGRLGVTLRSFSTSMARVRQAQYEDLDARARSGLLKGFAFLHLKKDLEADPTDWRDCQDPYDASADARPFWRRGPQTRYGISKEAQRLVADIRTDLDSFTEIEAYALMLSGYRMAQHEVGRLPHCKDQPFTARPWKFLEVEPLLRPGPAFEEVKRHLGVGKQVVGKAWRLSPVLRAVAVILAAAALYAAWLGWAAIAGASIPVRAIGVAALVGALTLVAPTVMRALRCRSTLRSAGLRSLAAAALSVVMLAHLHVIDPLFVRGGRLGRFGRLQKE